MTIKQYRIYCITKANGNEYLHGATISAESVKEAKEFMKRMIRNNLGRHAFRISNGKPDGRREGWEIVAERNGWTYQQLLSHAERNGGIPIYAR